MAEEITAFDTQITAIPEAAAAGLTDYKSFLSFRGDYLNGIRNTDGQADMDVEALLYRVYGGTNWYRIEALADTLETYDTQEDHRALIVSNRQQVGPAGGHGPAGGGAGKLRYDPFPAAVLCETTPLRSTARIWRYGAYSASCSCSPPPWCGTGCGTPGPCSGPPGGGGPILNVQMGAALLSALVLAVVNITVYVIPFLAQGPLQFAACGLDGIWEWGTPWFDWTYGTYLLVLAGLILALSLGAAGLTAFLSQYSGNYIAMLLKAVPLFVAVGVGAGLLASGSALHVPPPLGTATAPGCPGVRRRWRPQSCWHWGLACVPWPAGGSERGNYDKGNFIFS